MDVSRVMKRIPSGRPAPLAEYKNFSREAADFLKQGKGRSLTISVIPLSRAQGSYDLRVAFKSPDDLKIDQTRSSVPLACSMAKVDIERISFKPGIQISQVQHLIGLILDQVPRFRFEDLNYEHIEIGFSRDLKEQKVLGLDGRQKVQTPESLGIRIINKEPSLLNLEISSSSVKDLISKAQELFHYASGRFDLNEQLRTDIREWVRQANLLIPEMIEDLERFGWSQEMVRLFRFYIVFWGPLGRDHERIKITYEKLSVPRFEGEIYTLPEKHEIEAAQTVESEKAEAQPPQKEGPDYSSLTIEEFISKGKLLNRKMNQGQISQVKEEALVWIKWARTLIDIRNQEIQESGFSRENVAEFSLHRSLADLIIKMQKRLGLEAEEIEVKQYRDFRLNRLPKSHRNISLHK